MLIDQIATEENRTKAREAVEPTVYKQDQNIVVKGDRVTQEQYSVLESLGLLAGNSADYSMYFSAAAVLAAILLAGYLYVFMFYSQLFLHGKNAIVMGFAEY